MTSDETAQPSDPIPDVAVPTAVNSAVRVDRKLLELFVCPLTRTALTYDAKRQELVSRAARVAYPIRDGMPILVREEARLLDDPA